MRDDLGDRMKGQYENRTRFMLPRRTYTIIRLDGKAFHTYTRGLKKPFDTDLYADMDAAIIAMLPEIQGAVFAYTQSDEISILLTDFALPTTSAWFDGNLQKMCSVGASIITAEFNRVRMLWNRPLKVECPDAPKKVCLSEVPMAYFDARVFTIPDRTEVMNYFIWRNQDCSRNSVYMVAQANFSHKELQGVSIAGMHEMLHEKGINWATAFSDGEKNGRLIVKENYLSELTLPRNTDGKIHVDAIITHEGAGAMRSRWVSKGAWKFTDDKDKLLNMIPKYE
jgi:tRNA(His) 5'-end guanylyltransferase